MVNSSSRINHARGRSRAEKLCVSKLEIKTHDEQLEWRKIDVQILVILIGNQNRQTVCFKFISTHQWLPFPKQTLPSFILNIILHLEMNTINIHRHALYQTWPTNRKRWSVFPFNSTYRLQRQPLRKSTPNSDLRWIGRWWKLICGIRSCSQAVSV